MNQRITAVICIALTGLSSCRLNMSKMMGQGSETAANDTPALPNTDVQLDMEMQDTSLPGALENFLSLIYGTPVFGDGGSKRTELRYDPTHGLDPVKSAQDALASRPDLVGAITIEDGGKDSIVDLAQSETVLTRVFHGVCVDGKTFVLQGFDKARGNSQYITLQTTEYVLRVGAVMPTSYRPDIVGCQARFKELVKIKYREPAQAAAMLQTVETLNFVFSFIPGYSGAERISNGQAVWGTAEILADIATLGAACKFKAGWNSLRMSAGALSAINRASTFVALGSNMVRLGMTISEIKTRGATISDVPTVILLVVETGFVVAKIRTKAGSLTPGVLDTVVDASQAVKVLNGKKFLSLKRLIGDTSDEILIGVENSMHAFLMVGGKRVDGGILSRIKVRTAKGATANGAIIHLTGLDPETKRKLIDGINSYAGSPSLTCANTVCRILRNEGNIIVGSGSLIENSTPSQLLRNILEGNIKTAGGAPVNFNVYFSQTQNLGNYLDATVVRELGMVGLLSAEAIVVHAIMSDGSSTPATTPTNADSATPNNGAEVALIMQGEG